MSDPRRLLFVGAGPRAAMLLERLLARVGADAVLHVDLVDPHPPGAGRIWRRAQSPLLKLNSMARDVSVFTDDSCTIDGPVRPGPSLIEWAEAWRAGDLPDVRIDDELAAAEARGLRGDSFPTRRLHSFYLEWFSRRTVAQAPAGVTVRWHRDSVTGVRETAGGHRVWLASGATRDADVVVYCVGHNGRAPEAAASALGDAADREGLVYIAPDFTADVDLSVLPEGGDVIVRGFGLASIDLIVLLTQGRGGRFTQTDDGVLRYEPSGREPRLHIGSRRGVPYRSKVSSQVQGEAPQRDVLTPEVVAGLTTRTATLDFERDAWPLIASELLHGHYRELCTGHPERVRGTWPEVRALLQAHAWDDPALRARLDALVPDPLDRFDVGLLDRPFADVDLADDDAVQRRVRGHIADDLVLRTTQERSPAQGVFIAALLSFLALAEIPAERWNARSRAVSLPVRWHTFFSYVASGPPAHRLEEVLALADAGILRFLGPDVDVRVDAGTFVAQRRVGELAAPSLVDAWLPHADAAASDNAALRELATVHGTELHVRDEGFAGSLGRVHVDDAGRVLRADGRAHDGLFATGPFTSGIEGGAFSHPGIDALAFRQTDRVAAAIAAALGIPDEARAHAAPASEPARPEQESSAHPAPRTGAPASTG
ncbi:FAD/NAD(P)-binding protein [Microbacterium sp. No. 7]|uniref:FAD/NAD(P)-binding protein n=1 Tax=Microbacterium sp. No. 7 TaxID=1714373 RepID=UPI0006D284CA|nr:FAD/NAD(P)-binding protein [Microbacterium sp. No. 7]ALJ18510.1 hypothetical protein AOA12_00695 [Microbacterium sp. No. 7]